MQLNNRKKMNIESGKYVHGYTEKEAERLKEQASTLNDVIHYDSTFAEGSYILEAGCGVGAQTQIIAKINPGSKFISVDLSQDSLDKAQEMLRASEISNVQLLLADINHLPFSDETFDNVFICFLLEHLVNPVNVLKELKRVLKTGGQLIAIEGDHGSAFFYPDSIYAKSVINCQTQLQRQLGGNTNIGRELYPLVKSAGFKHISVSPRMIYTNANETELSKNFVKNIFTPMIEDVGKKAVKEGMIDNATFTKGISDLYRTAESNGVFNYTLFKVFGTK